MHIEFTLNWSWWQYFLAIAGAAYGAGVVYHLVKGMGLLSIVWPVFYLFGGIKM